MSTTRTNRLLLASSCALALILALCGPTLFRTFNSGLAPMSPTQSGSWTDVVSPDPGARFPAEKGRYHLYAAKFCPFAQRALILLKLKGIDEDVISTSIVHWFKGVADENGVYPGWHFATPKESEETPGCTPDPLFGAHYLSEIYFKAEPNYTGKYTVPVLWDKKTNTIVNNESEQIMRMLSTAFDAFVPPDRRNRTYFPTALASRIREIEAWMQPDVNSGVYKVGFATTQEDYDRAVETLFTRLDALEKLVNDSDGPFLLGSQLTDLDVRLYTTLVRFDGVYYTHFKCNVRAIRHGYPGLHAWLRRLYWLVPAFRETTDFLHIKRNYYVSHRDINTHGIVPAGPLPDIEPLDDAARSGWTEDGWKGFSTAGVIR